MGLLGRGRRIGGRELMWEGERDGWKGVVLYFAFSASFVCVFCFVLCDAMLCYVMTFLKYM